MEQQAKANHIIDLLKEHGGKKIIDRIEALKKLEDGEEPIEMDNDYS